MSENLSISRYPVPAVNDLPEDIRDRILAVQEKAGFVPNVFLALAHRPAEFRAFFAYHDALMEKEITMPVRSLGVTNTTRGKTYRIVGLCAGFPK